jgi:hypothetical protein
VGASASLDTPELNHAAFWLHNWPGSGKPDLFHKKAEEILELGQDALACISLGNVIHLDGN